MMKKFLTTALVLTCVTCTIALADTSNEAKMYYNQGVDLYRSGQYAQSVNMFRRAIGADPNYIDAYYNLGVILRQMNDNAEALNVFKQIIVRKPDDFDAVFNAAELSTKLGQTENAKKYLALIPQSSTVYSKAQELANSLNTDLQTIAKDLAEQATANMSNIPQSNGVYSNLPSPTGITTDKNGNLYVASFSNNSITKITPNGAKSDFVKSEKLNGPIDIASDNAGNIYVANYNTDNIVKITPSGSVIQYLSNISKPYCLHIKDGILFISSQGSNTVIRRKL